MKKTLIVAAGLLSLTATFSLTQIEGSFAQDSAKVTEKQDSTRKIADKLIQHVYLALDKPAYGAVAFDKATNTITLKDVAFKSIEGRNVIKSLEFIGYKNDPKAGSYSIDIVKAVDVTLAFHKEALASLEDQQASPDFSFPQIIYLGSMTGTGFDFSYKNNMLKVEETIVEGAGYQGKPEEAKVYWKDLVIELFDQRTTISEELLNRAKALPANGGSYSDLTKISSALLRNLSISSVHVRGFNEVSDNAGGSFKLGALVFKDVKDGVVKKLTLNDVEFVEPVSAGGSKAKIEKISIHNINIANAMTLPTPSQTPSVLQALDALKLISGLSITGVKEETSKKNSRSELHVHWGKFVGLYPTIVKMHGYTITSLKDSVRKSPPATKTDRPFGFIQPWYLLKVAGINELRVDQDIKIEWNEASQTIQLAPFMIDGDKLVKISLSTSIGNVSKELLLEKDLTKSAALALGANVGAIQIELTDHGLQRVLQIKAPGEWEKISLSLAKDPKLKPVADAISKFLSQPNGTLVLKLNPKGVVGFSQLSGAMMVDPATALSLFDIKARYLKN